MSEDRRVGTNGESRCFRESEIANWDRVTDVLVVGLGCAGACAALEADAAGAKVLVLERASAGGGTSALSGPSMTRKHLWKSTKR